MKAVIISGSARNDGNTTQLVQHLTELSNWDAIDLNDYAIGHFDYEHTNREDDFLPLMRKVIHEYDVFVFATPVYWYAMSGIMKVFFDRITDLITIEKDLGRKLRGKSMGVVTTSGGGNLGEQFWLPFQSTANYLGIHYLGNAHTLGGKDNQAVLKEFVEELEAAYVALRTHER